MKKKPTFAQVLRKARDSIEASYAGHICLAISYVMRVNYTHMSFDARMDLADRYRERIEAQLDGAGTYMVWVQRHHHKTYKRMLRIPGAFTQGRLQWIDDMLAKEKAK